MRSRKQEGNGRPDASGEVRQKSHIRAAKLKALVEVAIPGSRAQMGEVKDDWSDREEVKQVVIRSHWGNRRRRVGRETEPNQRRKGKSGVHHLDGIVVLQPVPGTVRYAVLQNTACKQTEAFKKFAWLLLQLELP